MAAGLTKNEMEWAREAGTAGYRSKKQVPTFDAFVGGGYLSNKKWPLNEGNILIHKYTIRLIVCKASCHPVTRSLSHSVTW